MFLFENFAEYIFETYIKDEVTFCTEYIRGGIQYRYHPNYCNKGAYYDWMLVLCDNGEKYPYKLIAYILGSANGFDGYHLIV